MLRVLALCLALLLPLQVTWAAAGDYCQHEDTTQGTTHFGHHLHVHKAGSNGAGGDADCASCHGGGSAPTLTVPSVPLLAMAEAYATQAPLLPPSAPRRLPDRPNWSRPVA